MTMTISQQRRLLFRPIWLVAPSVLLLAVFFVWPVLQLLVLSIQDNTGALSGANFQRIFSQTLYVRVLLVTLRIAAITAILSVLLGYPLAYWLSRLPKQTRGYMMLLVVVPFWTSYLVKTFAWMLILGRTGALNRILGGLDIGPLPLLQSEGAVIVGMVHGMLPLAVLTMLPVVSSIDRRLLQAAETLGAHPVRAFWLVHAPLALPGLASAGLLTFITSLGFFVVPALLGSPQQTFLAQIIIAQIQQLLSFGFASALSVILLAATFAAWVTYDRIFGISTLSGQQTRQAAWNGWSRRAGLIVARGSAVIFQRIAQTAATFLPAKVIKLTMPIYGFAILMFLAAPSLVVIPASLTSASFLGFPPQGISLRWFETYFGSPLWIAATLNSFVIGFITAVCATVIGGLAALALAKSRSRWNTVIFGLLLSPMVVPRIVFGVGLMYLFASLGLIGTKTGLVIGHTVLALPFTFVTLAAVLQGYDWRLDQAAATMGASSLRVLARITIPLIKDGLAAAFLFAFITSFDELTLALFVSGGLVTTLPKQMWDDMFLQLSPTIAAASVVVFTIVISLLLIAERATNKNSQ